MDNISGKHFETRSLTWPVVNYSRQYVTEISFCSEVGFVWLAVRYSHRSCSWKSTDLFGRASKSSGTVSNAAHT